MVSDSSRVAIVTGGAGGIGQATCEALIGDGARVAVVDLSLEAATATANSIDPTGQRAWGFAADVSDTDSVETLMTHVVNRFGQLDILVNNAGVIAPGRTQDVSDESWDRLIGIHLSGTFKCSRAAFRYLAQSSAPAIVSTTSIAGLQGFSQRASYCAAKAGVIGFTRSLAAEWAQHGIRVNAVAPGHTRTAMLDHAIAADVLPEARVNARIARIPLGRMALPSEIAAGIAFLASTRASYITGHTLVIDGGFTTTADELPAD